MILCKKKGVFARNDIKEASNAIEDEEHRVVDEEETLTTRIPAAGAQLRTPEMGGDARRR